MDSPRQSRLLERLERRERRRPAFGLSPEFYARFGLDDPWSSTDWDPGQEADQGDGFTFLSSSPYRAMMHRLAQARWRRERRQTQRLARWTGAKTSKRRSFPGEAPKRSLFSSWGQGVDLERMALPDPWLPGTSEVQEEEEPVRTISGWRKPYTPMASVDSPWLITPFVGARVAEKKTRVAQDGQTIQGGPAERTARGDRHLDRVGRKLQAVRTGNDTLSRSIERSIQELNPRARRAVEKALVRTEHLSETERTVEIRRVVRRHASARVVRTVFEDVAPDSVARATEVAAGRAAAPSRRRRGLRTSRTPLMNVVEQGPESRPESPAPSAGPRVRGSAAWASARVVRGFEGTGSPMLSTSPVGRQVRAQGAGQTPSRLSASPIQRTRAAARVARTPSGAFVSARVSRTASGEWVGAAIARTRQSDFAGAGTLSGFTGARTASATASEWAGARAFVTGSSDFDGARTGVTASGEFTGARTVTTAASAHAAARSFTTASVEMRGARTARTASGRFVGARSYSTPRTEYISQDSFNAPASEAQPGSEAPPTVSGWGRRESAPFQGAPFQGARRVESPWLITPYTPARVATTPRREFTGATVARTGASAFRGSRAVKTASGAFVSARRGVSAKGGLEGASTFTTPGREFAGARVGSSRHASDRLSAVGRTEERASGRASLVPRVTAATGPIVLRVQDEQEFTSVIERLKRETPNARVQVSVQDGGRTPWVGARVAARSLSTSVLDAASRAGRAPMVAERMVAAMDAAGQPRMATAAELRTRGPLSYARSTPVDSAALPEPAVEMIEAVDEQGRPVKAGARVVSGWSGAATTQTGRSAWTGASSVQTGRSDFRGARSSRTGSSQWAGASSSRTGSRDFRGAATASTPYGDFTGARVGHGRPLEWVGARVGVANHSAYRGAMAVRTGSGEFAGSSVWHTPNRAFAGARRGQAGQRQASSPDMAVPQWEGRAGLTETLGALHDGRSPRGSSPSWAERTQVPTRVRGGNDLVRALAKATNAEQVVQLIMERGNEVTSSALPSPVIQVIKQIQHAEKKAGYQPGRGPSAVPLRTTRTAGGVSRTSSAARIINGWTGQPSGTAQSLQGVGADRVMKLAKRLRDLVHLAENNRQGDAQKQARLAHAERPDARHEDGGDYSQADSNALRNVDIDALSREVLDLVNREMELRQERRQEDSDGDIWW